MSTSDPEQLRAELRTALQDVRATTLALVAPLDDATLHAQHSTIMSPLVWDLGHIANFEALWLLTRLGETLNADPALDRVYDPFRNPRPTRAALACLHRGEVMDYLGSIRHRVLEVLDRCDFDPADPLLHDGYVYWMIIQHEAQHQETMLQALDLHRSLAPYPPAGARSAAPAAAPAVDDTERCSVAGGTYELGIADRVRAYDNERPVHRCRLEAFDIDRFPVTCRRYAEFIADGGYQRGELWSDPGRRWQQETGHTAPQGWFGEGEQWRVRRFGHEQALQMDSPVQHVSFHEAEAFARWAGGRLPSEQEWEVAAAGTSARHANLGIERFAPAAVGSRPETAARSGAEQMLGDTYEWTSSPFTGYPGFSAFPYREYSEVFFGPEYRVLRGASWATSPHCARITFRNWDYPIRRQIFAGCRVAWDA